MEKDLQSYVKIYNDWFDKDQCKKTIEEIKKFQWHQHMFYHARKDDLYAKSGDKELDICFENPSTYDYLVQRFWDGIYKYITDLNFSWYDNWSGFNRIRFNHYKTGRTMALHCDHIHSMFDGERKGVPILTEIGRAHV